MFCLETTFTLDYLIGLIYTLHPYKQILLIMKTIEIYYTAIVHQYFFFQTFHISDVSVTVPHIYK